MASGIEVAGLIIGVLPLVVSVIEDYRAGLEPFKIWVRYRRELQELRKVLEIETSKLLNTCEEVLASLVSEAKLAILLRNPGGVEWSSDTLKNKLQNLLRHSYRPFISSLDDFKDAILELQAKLEDGLPKDATGKRSTFSWEGVIDRLKYTFSADKRSKLKDTLKRSNKALLTLTRSSMILAPTRSRRTTRTVDFEEVRKTACGVFDVLETGPWHCSCQVPHNANLLLEPRVLETSQLRLPLRFRVLFSFDTENSKPLQPPWNWHETDIVPCECIDEVRPLQSLNSTIGQLALNAKTTPRIAPTNSKTMPPPAKKKKTVQWTPPQDMMQTPIPLQISSSPTFTAKQILNLCATLQQVCEGKGCLGALTDRQKRQYQIIAVRKQPRALVSKDMVRLADILSAPPLTPDGSSKAVSRQPSAADLRSLAFTFASTILQLRETPWLKERWGKDDIKFLRDVSAERRPIVRLPYISRGFSSSANVICTSDSTVKIRSGPMIRNQTLFDLGVLLIELCFKRSLEDMRQPEDLGDDGKVNKYTDFATANRLIEEVYEKVGARYGDAVRRCVRCEFDQRTESFDNDEFRQAVYNKVLLPLENEYKDFNFSTG